MNRMKKEELKKEAELRAGLSQEQIDTLELAQHAIQAINKLQNHLHIQLFPEETDFINDSIQDAKDRARGINPMSKAYQEKVNKRRKALGVTSLDSDGMCRSKDSNRYSQSIANALLDAEDDAGLKAQIKAAPQW